MNQYSLNGEDLEIKLLTGDIIFIDPLFLGKIASASSIPDISASTSCKSFIKELEVMLFPYGGGTLIGYKRTTDNVFRLQISSIGAFDDDNEMLNEQSKEKEITTVGIDSASFLVVDFYNFIKILELVSYNDLATLERAEDFRLFFEKINNLLGNECWGYVLSPGIDSGFVFDGDGEYIIS